MSKRNCTICGAKSYSDYCFRHKPRRQLQQKRHSREYKPKEKVSSELSTEKSVKVLKPALWTIMSKYIRLRDSDENGIFKCITCGAPVYWKFGDAGHFIPRTKGNATYFEECNLAGQCETCNQYKGGMQQEFAEALDRKHGEGTADRMRALAQTTRKFLAAELYEMIVHYTAEVSRLLQEKKSWNQNTSNG